MYSANSLFGICSMGKINEIMIKIISVIDIDRNVKYNSSLIFFTIF